jgi:hypothetical protein
MNAGTAISVTTGADFEVEWTVYLYCFVFVFEIIKIRVVLVNAIK